MDALDETAKGHVDGGGEEGRAEEGEDVGEDVGAHCSGVIVRYTTTDITDAFDWEILSLG